MALKFFITGFYIYILNAALFAQSTPSIQWQKCYGGSTSDVGTTIVPALNGGYIVAGTTTSNNGDVSLYHGGMDWWVLKLDAVGAISWQRTLGGIGHQRQPKLLQLADGGFIVAGYTETTGVGDIGIGHGDTDGWILKLDSNGTLLWNKLLGGSGEDVIHELKQTADGGFIAVGYTWSINGEFSVNHGESDWWVLKLDSVANIQWQKLYGGTQSESVSSVYQTFDGGFILSGRSTSEDGDVLNGSSLDGIIWIVKTDSLGNISWQKSVLISDYPHEIRQTTDSGYVWAGVCTNNLVPGWHGNSDACVLRMDKSGNLLWQKALGGSASDIASSIKQTPEGGFIVAGSTQSTNGDVSGSHGAVEGWLMKLSQSGVLQWQKCLGGSGNERIYNIELTPDLGYICTGFASSNNSGDVGPSHGFNDFWVVKLAPDGTIPVLLTKFDVLLRGNQVFCTWQTSQEQNSSHFIIERSLDGRIFHQLGHVSASSNSNLLRNYFFTDENPHTGLNFYRLKMVDLDNSFSNSEVKQVNYKVPSDLVIFPNPVTETTQAFFWSEVSMKTNFSIIDMAGREMMSKNVKVDKGSNILKIDVNQLASGSYYLRILLASNIFIERFIKI